MTEILRKAIYGYNFVFDELTDPRTKSWLLVAKPYEGAAILGLYLMFVFKWGPMLMKNRPPFNLDRIMVAYNVLQIFLCGYVFVLGIPFVLILILGFLGSIYSVVHFKWHLKGLTQVGFKKLGGLKDVWIRKYKLFCEPVDYSDNEDALKICYLIYLYYLLKFLDLADTIFFVLRKKFNQISFLHVYHHTGMVMLVWGAITYLPGGHGTSIGLINSLVHVFMYSYYLLTVAFPQVKQSLSFKKCITQIQIVQFFLCVVHMGAITFIPDCEYPRWTVAVFLPQNLFILILFLDFYIKTYVKKPKNDEITKKIDKCVDSNSDEKGVVQHIIERNDNTKTSRKIKRS